MHIIEKNVRKILEKDPKLPEYLSFIFLKFYWTC